MNTPPEGMLVRFCPADTGAPHGPFVPAYTMRDSAPGETARELASAMHSDAVNLWNRYWSAAGESPYFVERAVVEQLQRLLCELAWPDAR